MLEASSKVFEIFDVTNAGVGLPKAHLNHCPLFCVITYSTIVIYMRCCMQLWSLWLWNLNTFIHGEKISLIHVI
jgi:hypothetical protein